MDTQILLAQSCEMNSSPVLLAHCPQVCVMFAICGGTRYIDASTDSHVISRSKCLALMKLLGLLSVAQSCPI